MDAEDDDQRRGENPNSFNPTHIIEMIIPTIY